MERGREEGERSGVVGRPRWVGCVKIKGEDDKWVPMWVVGMKEKYEG
jgi:hypothetical protein